MISKRELFLRGGPHPFDVIGCGAFLIQPKNRRRRQHRWGRNKNERGDNLRHQVVKYQWGEELLCRRGRVYKSSGRSAAIKRKSWGYSHSVPGKGEEVSFILAYLYALHVLCFIRPRRWMVPSIFQQHPFTLFLKIIRLLFYFFSSYNFVRKGERKKSTPKKKKKRGSLCEQFVLLLMMEPFWYNVTHQLVIKESWKIFHFFFLRKGRKESKKNILGERYYIVGTWDYH